LECYSSMARGDVYSPLKQPARAVDGRFAWAAGTVYKPTMEDRDLLREYIEHQSGAAFAELVERHAGLVYSVALRLAGDSHQARDLAQTVFISLAQNARTIRSPEALSGWLCRATRFAAAKAIRSDQRRRQREHEAMHRTELEAGSSAAWDALKPWLEEALGRLSRLEQDAVVMRFFEGKSLRETGAVLALSENATGKRVDRALEKLRAHFASRGVVATSALLAEAIGANSVQAAPAGLAAAWSGAALAGAASAGTAGVLGKILAMTTKTKLFLGAAALALLATSTFWEYQKIAQLNAELAAARQDLAMRKKLAADEANRPLPTLAQVLHEGGLNPLDSARDALRLVENLKPGEIRAALEVLNKRPARTDDDIYMLRNLLMARWAQSDPNAALAWIKTKDPDHRETDYIELFQTWVTLDPEAALAGLKQLNNQWDKVNAAGWMLGGLAETNPQEAMSLLQEMPANEQHVGLRYRMFSQWATADPVAAATAAENMPPSFGRTAALEGTAMAWAMQDPLAAMAWADTLTDPSAKSDALGEALGQLSNENPAAAARYVEAMPAGARNDVVAGVAALWAQTDPPAALAWVANISTGQVYDQAVQGILGQIGQTDPAGAAAIIAQLPDPTTRYGAITQLADQWAQNDFNGALAWVQSLPTSDGNARAEALKNVMKNWDDSDPAGAAAYLTQNLANDPNFNTVADQLVGRWAVGDPQAALAWAQALPPGPTYDSTVTTALTDLAKTDPQSAWDTATHLSDTTAEAQAMLAVVQSWSTQNPAQAAAVFNQIPAGAQQVQAATTLAAAWVGQDPTAASQWISTLPPGDARDAAVTKLIGAEGANDPATAFNWAKSISNPDTQQTQLNNVVSAWAKTDPTAASNAVQAAGLTDAQKAALLSTVQKAVPAK
jgi:RNA polymerase sigma factor (sigma-70 family)